jgi:predicted dehydrogenase
MKSALNRREFLGLTAGAAAGLIWAEDLMGAGIGSRDIRLGIIGVGSRGTGLTSVLLAHGRTQVAAVCDINPQAAERAAGIVEKARGKRPETYTNGPEDYFRLLKRDDLDAVGVFTPIPLHAPMSVAAMRAGKAVLSEVPAATTLQECWDLVKAAEETGRFYMLSENCCYYESCMMILNMVEKGLFGDLTYAECGYIHDCRSICFNADGTLTWRGELHRDGIGNWYPTHSVGPVGQWLGINRVDRFASLTAATTPPTSMTRYAAERFGKDHPAARIKWRCGDTTNALIRTDKGVLIEIRFDIASARPHPMTTHYMLQGTKGAYLFDGERIWIEGKTKNYAWEPAAAYMKEYQHPLWQKWGKEGAGSGHGGADYFVTRAFLEALRAGTKSPIDVYDAAAWSSIIPLTAASIETGGKPQEFPDFKKNAKT